MDRLRYACRKENHFLQACHEILVVTDCREMISTYIKPLETIKNRRIQKMFLDICHLFCLFSILLASKIAPLISVKDAQETAMKLSVKKKFL